ncbi:hypothetical protein [Pseudomonas rhizophila]
MRHLFEENGAIYEYSDDQINIGYGANMRRLSEEESEEHLSLNSAKEDNTL